MKTKKLLSVILALAIVISMVAAFTVTSSAAIREKFVGDTVTFRITGKLSTDEEEGNVKSITFATGINSQTGAPYVDGELLSTEQAEEIIKVTVKATNAGNLALSYQIYSEGNWASKKTYSTEVYPTIMVGETVTGTIHDRTLYPDNPNGNVKNITAENATVVSTVQNGDDIDVTLKATSVGTIYVIYDENVEGSQEFSNDGMVIAKAISAITYLDLDNSTTDILEKKTLDQNYNLTVNESVSAENEVVTKVKLSWEIKDINATRTDNKVWDTENLCWKTDSSSATVNQKGNAKFTLENYSSVKVDATAKFEALSDTGVTVAFDEATGTDGTITLETANGSETYSKTNAPKGEITVTVTPSDAFFKDKNATTTATKYGTYTVTISKSITTSFVFSGFFDGTAENATVNGIDASALCQYMVDNDMIADAGQFGDILVKSTYYSMLQKKNITGSKALSLLFDTTHQEYGTATGDTLAGDNDYVSDKTFVIVFNGSFIWDGSSFIKNS